MLNRSLLALALGCTLASLPMSVRAQDTPASAEPTPAAADAMPATTTANSKKESSATVTGAKLSTADKDALHKMANGNLGEVQLAKLALTNSESQDVKDFAQKMIDDHGKANEDLIAIGKAHGTDYTPKLSSTETLTFDKMRALKGSTFDANYIKHAVADHTDDVKEYQKDAKTVKDADLLAYVEKTTPIVEDHLKMAKDIQSKMGPTGAEKKSKQS